VGTGVDRRGSGTGWVTFVGVFMIIVGSLNLIWGISALANKSYFHESGLLFSNLQFWGWVAIILGAVQLLAGFGVFSGSLLATVVVLTLAVLGIVENLLQVGAYPIWSIIAIAINGLIVWAVTVHADAFTP
jgi:hypothetical protein